MARNTRTGSVLEQMILPALDQGGYAYDTQVHLGQRLGLGRHLVDAVASKDGRKFLISLKWQQVSGTAEQKVPFEVISLIEALETGNFEKAYVVLGGEGWTLRDFYTAGGLKKYLIASDKVEVCSTRSVHRKSQPRKVVNALRHPTTQSSQVLQGTSAKSGAIHKG